MPDRDNDWVNLPKLTQEAQAQWIRANFKAVLQTLTASPADDLAKWNLIGFSCINSNLYREAEQIYDELVKKTKQSHRDFGSPAYYRGIAKFLQGRFKEAYEDFKLSHQHDMRVRNFNGPTARALAYMEETLFPTKEIIRSNQDKLFRDLNNPRVLERTLGAHKLRTIHKWNSASPLFSRAVSQGGGYFLTLRNPHGQTKGIAIDPGYDFFDIFRNLGLGIADLDAIVITHDHDDHTESVEGILSLLAKYNDHHEEKQSKVVDIFGSAGVLLKFHGLLSATDLFGNREINFKLMVPGSEITEIEGASLKEKYGFTLKVISAHHIERWTNQESSVGVVITTMVKDKEGKPLKIGITGDTRYEAGLGRHYGEAQVLLLNIGSIEKEEGKMLSQHLGMLGCINLLKEARLGKSLLAVLTEFGEEFSGKRETISHIIENWAQPMEGVKSRELKVIPADVNLEVNLEDLTIRETSTNVFFPYQLIEVDESDPETLKYRFRS